MLAAPSDVETSLVRTLTPSEADHVGKLLERAEGLIREKIPDFLARTGDGEERDETFIAKVIHVTSDAVARVFRNPGAFRQETEGNYSYTLDREAASGLLSIEDWEWERLGLEIAAYGTQSTITDAYARRKYTGFPYYLESRPDLIFQWGWPGDKPGDAEVII